MITKTKIDLEEMVYEVNRYLKTSIFIPGVNQVNVSDIQDIFFKMHRMCEEIYNDYKRIEDILGIQSEIIKSCKEKQND